MTLFAFTDCCRLLGTDAKTLRHWLHQAQISMQIHPSDARIKCVTQEQLLHIAALHARPLFLSQQQEASSSCSPPGPQEHSQAPSHIPLGQSERVLMERVQHLEDQVSILQQQLTQLTLEVLQERTQRIVSSPQAFHPSQTPPPHPPLPQEMDEAAWGNTRDERGQQERERRNKRCLHPAEVRARARAQMAPPLIEYGATGSYVIMCIPEGELSLIPDSDAWFDWLATLSSFRFVGQHGRFTAYRKGSHHKPSRLWSAQRYIHQHNYKYYLGITDRLTIASLEQAAMHLQSHSASL